MQYLVIAHVVKQSSGVSGSVSSLTAWNANLIFSANSVLQVL